MIRTLVLLLIWGLGQSSFAADGRPKVLFFANPMSSDNHIIRRSKPNEPAVAERRFVELCGDQFDVTVTQSGADVNATNLADRQVVVFFTALDPPGVDVDALIAWVKNGGAFVGIHSTANSFLRKPAFGEMLGADFDRRPWRTATSPQLKVVVKVNDAEHPATRRLPASFSLTDDIYQFKNFDPTKSRLLLSLDPAHLDLSNPKVNREDRLFPVSWAREFGEGRVFYTMLGDGEATWIDPHFRTHLTQAILWAVKRADQE